MSIGSIVFLKDSFKLEEVGESNAISVDVVSSVGGRNLFIIDGRGTLGSYRSYNSAWVVEGPTISTTLNEGPGLNLTLSQDAMLEKPDVGRDFTISGYIKVNGEIPSKNIFTSRLNTQMGAEKSMKYDPDTGLLEVVIFDYKSYIIHAHTTLVAGDLLEIEGFKVEYGNKATPWTPAPEDITEDTDHPLIDKINLLLSEPLRSAGDVKDRLFRDSDGLWKIERKVTSFEVSENDVRLQSTGDDFIRFRLIHPLQPTASALSNGFSSTHLPYGRNMDGTPEINNGGGNPMIYVWLKKSSLPTPDLEGFINWVSSQRNNGTPFIIQYEIRDYAIETLPDELQDKLNNLRSFQDSNYVFTIINGTTDIISENLKPTLHATFKGGGWYVRWKLGSETDRLDNKITDGMEEVSTAVNAEWKTEADSIRGDVEATYVTANDFATLQRDVSTSFTQTEEAFDFRFKETETQVSGIEGDIETLESEINKYIRFVDGSIILGVEGSTSEVIITNEKISFMQGGDSPVAFIEGQKMQINHGIFVDSATIAGFKFQLVSGTTDVLGITWTDN